MIVMILAHDPSQKLLRAIESGRSLGKVVVVSTTRHDEIKQLVTSSFSGDSVSHLSYVNSTLDFAEARNWCLSKALSEFAEQWVFFLDSDEWFYPESGTTIQALSARKRISAISIVRRDVFRGQPLRHGEWGNAQIVRVVRADHCQFAGAVHERAVCNGIVLNSDALILHEAHDSISSFWKKISWYADIDSVRLEKLPVWMLMVQACFFSIGKCAYLLFWKRGLLDGWPGLVYSLLLSVHSFTARIRAYEKRLAEKR